MRFRTWLEELAFREQYYTGTKIYYSAGVIAGRNPGKLYMKIGRFLINISGYLCSFGTALFVVQDIGSVQVVVAAGWPRKSI